MIKKNNFMINKFTKLSSWYNRCKRFQLSIKGLYTLHIINYLIFLTFIQLKNKYNNPYYNNGLYWEKFYIRNFSGFNSPHTSYIKSFLDYFIPKRHRRNILRSGLLKNTNFFKSFGIKQNDAKFIVNYYSKSKNNNNIPTNIFKHKKSILDLNKSKKKKTISFFNNHYLKNIDSSSKFFYYNYIQKNIKYNKDILQVRINFLKSRAGFTYLKKKLPFMKTFNNTFLKKKKEKFILFF